jgi:hypothetical protein
MDLMSFESAKSHVQMWANTYSSVDEIPTDKIPEVYDLRNMGGNDFTSMVKD